MPDDRLRPPRVAYYARQVLTNDTWWGYLESGTVRAFAQILHVEKGYGVISGFEGRRSTTLTKEHWFSEEAPARVQYQETLRTLSRLAYIDASSARAMGYQEL